MSELFVKLRDGLAALDEHYMAEIRNRRSEFVRLDTSCREIGRELERLRASHETQQKALKARFNVFTALLKFRDEVKLHSRWLHYLLNPSADHDCATLFLDLFIQVLRRGVQPHDDDAHPDHLRQLETFVTKTAKVEKEVTIRYGIDRRVDISMESPQWGIIVIENKTALGERPDQIHDYTNYCIKRCSGRHYLLLYLTPFGNQAQTAGEHKDKYYRISYINHVLPWLEECLRATYQFVHINQALQQYRNVVNQLVGSTSDQAYMDQIIEILKKHPTVIEHLNEINQAVDKLRASYRENFFQELRKQLSERNMKLGPEKPEKKYSSFVIETERGFRWNKLAELKLTLEYGIEEHCLYVGLVNYDTEESVRKAVWEDRSRYASVTEHLAREFSDRYDEGNDWWPLGWIELLKEKFMTDSFLAENGTEHSRPLFQQVTDLVKIISRYLEVVDQVWAHTDTAT